MIDKESLKRCERPNRHPAKVTADRLTDHRGVYYTQLRVAEREALQFIRDALVEIAEGRRRK